MNSIEKLITLKWPTDSEISDKVLEIVRSDRASHLELADWLKTFALKEVKRLTAICIMADVPSMIIEGLTFGPITEEDRTWAKEEIEKLTKLGVIKE